MARGRRRTAKRQKGRNRLLEEKLQIGLLINKFTPHTGLHVENYNINVSQRNGPTIEAYVTERTKKQLTEELSLVLYQLLLNKYREANGAFPFDFSDEMTFNDIPAAIDEIITDFLQNDTFISLENVKHEMTVRFSEDENYQGYIVPWFQQNDNFRYETDPLKPSSRSSSRSSTRSRSHSRSRSRPRSPSHSRSRRPRSRTRHALRFHRPASVPRSPSNSNSNSSNSNLNGGYRERKYSRKSRK